MGKPLPRYQSVDALQIALATTIFADTGAPKKAAGRALGTLVELITFYMIRDWGLERSLAIERGLTEYGNSRIKHNVEFTLHPADSDRNVPRLDLGKTMTSRQIALSVAATGAGLGDAVLRPQGKLLGSGVLRHACTFAEEPDAFWIAYMTGADEQFQISRLKEEPFAMFECKRVGIEDGQKKGPQTIEKAKQGAYVARSVSGLQRISRRDGRVAGLVEELDGQLTLHDDYYGFLQGAIDAGNLEALANVVLTVGVVSNHGNWFTADEHSKEMRVLAQSYDWLLFLTDLGLAQFIEDVLQGHRDEFEATRKAFTASFGRTTGGVTRFTKVTMGVEADRELTSYFESYQPWDRWFNVIAPGGAPIEKLRDDLLRLQGIHDFAWGNR
jgi:hypothetical protein